MAAAGKADAAVVFVNQASGEGMDRDGLNLPGDQDSLVEAVSRANPHTIVVLNTPGAVLMPWLHRVAAVIQAWYPGRAVGSATASVLFGDADPGGRLPVTFPASAAQGPIRSAAEYPGVAGQVSYDEGVFVGYRYYQEHGQTPLFPFGHGLSYSSFRYTDLRVVRSDGDAAMVEAKVTNVGPRVGTAVAEVYVGRLPTPVATPPRQLAGFAKVMLRPGEAALLTMRVPGRVLSYWDEQTRSWVMPAGRVAVYVGNSSADTELTGSLLVGAG